MEKADYQVIARRWRPKTFEDLIGQEVIVQTLSNAITSQHLAHAWLFVGPRGTGKTSTARLLSMALNCENGPNIHFDPESPICQSIFNGNCMDVIEIDAASNNSVEQIRQLREECQYQPATCRFKIYILDEIHMLSNAAFNALLKTLEEPPAHAKFIFATTELTKVPATIISRCQRFEFRPISNDKIAHMLLKIAEKEGTQLSLKTAETIAALANGGLRDAESLFEQLMLYTDKAISEEHLVELYGLAHELEIEQLLQVIEKRDFQMLLSTLDTLEARNSDFLRVLQEIQRAIQKKIRQSTDNARINAYLQALEVLYFGEESFRESLSPRIHFEVFLFKACERFHSVKIETVLSALRPLMSEQKKQKTDTLLGESDQLAEKTRAILKQKLHAKISEV